MRQHDIEYASRSTRLLVQILDALVALVPMVGATLFLRLGSDNAIPAIVGWLVAVSYYFLADGLQGGQSLAKRWLDIRVIDADTGAPCTFMQSFVRNLLLAVLGPIDWVFIFGERHQRLGDKAAGTIVVTT